MLRAFTYKESPIFYLTAGLRGGRGARKLLNISHFLLDELLGICYNMNMKMTRKHFQALATLVGEVSVESDLNHKQEANLTDQVIFLCRSSNSSFDVHRFCAWVKKIKEKQLSA